MKRNVILAVWMLMMGLTCARAAFGQILTTTSVTSTANPCVYTQPVTFTVTVTPSSMPTALTGNVYLVVNGESHVAPVEPDGTQTFYIVTLGVGGNDIRASYGGDASYAPSAAPTYVQVVNAAASTTTLTASPDPAAFGQNVYVTVKVSGAPPALGSPTGNVSLLLNGALLATFPLDPYGNGSKLITPPAGRNTLTATFEGSATFQPSTGQITETVNQGASWTDVYIDPEPSVYGQKVTVTARVGAIWPATQTPTGTVTFVGNGLPPVAVPLVDGWASVTTDTLPLGANVFSAGYSGDSSYVASNSPEVTANVNQAATITLYTSSQNPSVLGQSVTFMANVMPGSPSTATPTGSVTFRDGGLTLGTVPLVDGVARFTTSALTAGSHTISATYLGDANFTASGGTGPSQSVVAASANVTLAAKPSTLAFGEPLVLTATVTGSAWWPTGTVDFLEGSTVLASGVKLGPSGQAICTISLPSATTHTYLVQYSGDANYGPASATTSATVNKGVASIDVGSSANPTVCGQPVTLTAVLGGPKGAPSPTGLVHFLDNGKEIGQASVSDGVANLTPSLDVGSHPVTVHYDGDSSYKAGDGTLSGSPQLVGQGATTAVVTSSQNPSTPTQAVTFTAVVTAVAPAVGTPGGTVEVLDGGVSLATVPVASGLATFTTPLSLGSHDITVAYHGDASFLASTATLSGGPQLVRSVVATVRVSAAPTPLSYGTSLTLTAAVAASSGGGAPGGTVTFRDGSAVIATVPLFAGTASCKVALPLAGAHTWFADYGGDGTFDPAIGSLTLPVGRAPVGVTVTSALNPAPTGQAFTLTTVVSLAGTAPDDLLNASGSVTFYDGSVVLGTATLDATGTATLSTSSTVAGPHFIHAAYSGDANFLDGASSALTQTITPQPITVVVSSPTAVLQGGAATYTISVSATDGFDSEIVFTCTGLPAGLSYRFEPPSLPAGTNPATTRLTIFATRTAAMPFGIPMAAMLLALVVALVPQMRPVVRLACTTSLMVLVLVLALAGCGGGGSGTTTLPTSDGQTVSTTVGVAPGTYPFTVNATSGSKSVSQALTVSVP